MRNVRGRWLERLGTWRKISLNTWAEPDNATIYGDIEVDVGPLQEYLEARTEERGIKCTMTHAVTRAVALILRRYPECNVLVRNRRLWLRDDVDVFLQVAMPDGKGGADLSGAVVRRADTKQVHEIAQELRERAAAVRAKKDTAMARTREMMLSMPGPVLGPVVKLLGWLSYTLNVEVPGSPRDPFGSAMVTSVGMLGISRAYAPLVTFSRCPMVVLVGKVEDRAVVRDGQVVVRPMCTITASLDHRVLDGFLAGLLAKEIRRLLEQPELLDRSPQELAD